MKYSIKDGEILEGSNQFLYARKDGYQIRIAGAVGKTVALLNVVEPLEAERDVLRKENERMKAEQHRYLAALKEIEKGAPLEIPPNTYPNSIYRAVSEACFGEHFRCAEIARKAMRVE